MLYVAAYLLLLPLLAAILLLPGIALARWIGWVSGDRPRLLDSAILGITVWVTLLFTLAVVGLYSPFALRVAALLVAGSSLALWWAKGPASPLVRGAGARLRLPRPPGGPAILVLAVIGGLAALFLHALDPTIAWDAEVYHLALPKLYLEAGGFRPVPFNVYSHWPSNVQLLYGLGLALHDHVLATLLHFLFGLLTLAALFALCREAGRPTAGWLASALFLANGVVLFDMRVAYTDLAMAFLMTAAVVYLLRAGREASGGRADLLLAGLAAGLLAGVKLTGWLALPCLAALYLAAGGASRGWGGRLRPFAVWTLIPAALLVAPWLVRSALATGNPVYPFLYSRLGGVEWSAELAERFHAWQRSIGMGREPLDFLLLPVRVILEGGRGYARFDGEIHDLWIVLLPLAILLSVSSPWVRRCLGVAGLYFLFWALASQQMRFLIPALPMVAAAAALTVVDLLDRIPRGAWRAAGVQGVALGASLLLVLEARAQLPPTVTLARGLWTHGFEAKELALPPLARALHEHTPEDAHLLFVNHNRRFHVDREILADSFFEASQIAHLLFAGAGTPEELLARLRGQGITHVLLHRPQWTIPVPPSFLDLLGDPDHVRQIFVSPDGRFLLFELRARESQDGGLEPL